MVLFTEGCVRVWVWNELGGLSKCEMSENLDRYMKYTLQFTEFRAWAVALYGHLWCQKTNFICALNIIQMIVCLNSIRSQVIFFFLRYAVDCVIDLQFLIVCFIWTVKPSEETNKNGTGSINDIFLFAKWCDIFSIILYTWCLTDEKHIPNQNTHSHSTLGSQVFFFQSRVDLFQCQVNRVENQIPNTLSHVNKMSSSDVQCAGFFGFSHGWCVCLCVRDMLFNHSSHLVVHVFNP